MRIRSIKKNIESQLNPLYWTLIGSIITSIGIITGKSEEQNYKLYKELNRQVKRNKELLGSNPTVMSIFNYIWTIYGDNEKKPLRANLVLVSDKYNVRGPLVTLVDGEGHILPLKQDGEYTGILLSASSGSSSIDVEYLFDEEGNNEDCEEET